MQVLSKKTVCKLDSIYTPLSVVLDPDDLHNSDKYDLSYFSVFNHRLTNEEAEKQILFYQHALEDVDSPRAKQYYEYHDQFLEFYLSLYNQTSVYGAFGSFSKRYANVVKFDSIEEYKLHALANIREQCFMGIVLPEFSSVISGNFDLVHLLYTLKSEPERKEKIILLIKKQGLFILS